MIDPKAYFHEIDRQIAFTRVLAAPVVWSKWLVIVNFAIYFAAFAFGLDRFVTMPGDFTALQYVLYTGMKVNTYIDAGQYWRLLSNMFVHMGLLHIGMNMYGLWTFGALLEKFYGGRRFLIIYIGSGLVGALASYFFTPLPSGGASGAIYGLVGALSVFGLKFRTELPPHVSKAFTTGMFPWVAVGIGIGFLDALPFDNAAHLGGLLSGGLFALMMRSQLDRTPQKKREKVVAVLFAACLLAMSATAYLWATEATNCIGSAQAFTACYPERAQSGNPNVAHDDVEK